MLEILGKQMSEASKGRKESYSMRVRAQTVNSRNMKVCNLGVPPTRCVTLSKIFNLSKSQFFAK